MNPSEPTVLAIHPVLEGFALNPRAGGKDLAAGECTNVLLEMGCKVYVWPLNTWSNGANEVLLSTHEIFWSSFGRVTIVPTCHPPDLKSFFKQWLHHFKASNFGVRTAWRRTMDELLHRPLDALEKVMAEVRPDLIHVHQTLSPLVSELRKRGLRTPVLLTHHSARMSPHLSHYDWVVASSLWTQNEIRTQFPGLTDRCLMIPYFVLPEYLQADEPPKRTGICFLGLLNDDRKGLDILLEALIQLKQAGKIYPLNVIGEGSKLADYQAIAAKAGLDVTFHGKLPATENARLLRETALFCMPSRAESFGIVYLEALACGAPVIGFAPAVQELRERLDDEVGAPFDANSQTSGDLARLIEEWMTKKGDAFAIRRAKIRDDVRKKFSLSAYRSSYRELYRQLLSPVKQGTPK